MRRLFRRVDWHLLTRTDYAWLHFKFALLVMLAGAALLNLTVKATLTTHLLFLWVGVSAAGFVLSVAGLVLGAQHNGLRQKGFRLEMAGLWLLLGGPLVFLAVQAGIWIASGEQKFVAVTFPYTIIAAVIARMVMVKTAMRTVMYRFPGEREDGDD